MTAFPHSLLQQTDVNGSPLSGWSVIHYLTGTNTPVLVWKDVSCTAPHATPVRADGQGRLPTVYYKKDGRILRADITFPDGRTKSIDGIDPGSSADVSSDPDDPRLPSVSHTGLTVTLVATDAGKVHEIPSTLGNATAVLLPRASTLTNGQIIAVRNTGAGIVIVRTQGVDLVNERVSFLLTDQDETALVLCTAAGFELIGGTPKAPSKFVVLSNAVRTPPVSAAAGVAYLAPIDSTGVWAPNSVYTADGVGGWIRHAPLPGDEAVITGITTTTGDGTVIPTRLMWSGSAWVDESLLNSQSRFVVQSATTSVPPASSPVGTKYLAPVGATGVWTANSVYTSDGTGGWVRHQPVLGDEVIARDATATVGAGTSLPVRLFYAGGSGWVDETLFSSRAAVLNIRSEYASGTSSATAYTLGAGAPAVNVNTQAQLNTTVSNTITGASVTSNIVTLPKGNYRIRGRHKFKGAIAARLKFLSTSTVTSLLSMPLLIPASTTNVLEVNGTVAVTAATESFQLMFILAGTATALTLGEAAAISGEPEVYSELFIETL